MSKLQTKRLVWRYDELRWVFIWIGYLLSISIVHELGHAIGILMIGHEIVGIRVPWWLSGLESTFVLPYPPPNIWAWAVRVLPSLEWPLGLIPLIIVPIVLQAVVVWRLKIPIQYITPIILYFHLYDFIRILELIP